MQKFIFTLLLFSITFGYINASKELVDFIRTTRIQHGFTPKTETLIDYSIQLQNDAQTELKQNSNKSLSQLSSLFLEKNMAICFGTTQYHKSPYNFSNIGRIGTELVKSNLPFLLEPGYIKVGIGFDTTSPPEQPQRFCLMFTMSDDSIIKGMPVRIRSFKGKTSVDFLPIRYHRFSRDIDPDLSKMAKAFLQDETAEPEGFDKENYSVCRTYVPSASTTSWSTILAYLISVGESQILNHLNLKMGMHFKWQSDSIVLVSLVFEKLKLSGTRSLYVPCLEKINAARVKYMMTINKLTIDPEACKHARKGAISCGLTSVAGKPIEKSVIEGFGFPKITSGCIFLQGEFDTNRDDDPTYELQVLIKLLDNLNDKKDPNFKIFYSTNHSTIGFGSEVVRSITGTTNWNFFIYFQGTPEYVAPTATTKEDYANNVFYRLK